MAACYANDALHLFPGTVYNYGSPMPAGGHRGHAVPPDDRKGRIRCAMEALFRREADAGRVRTIILRAGDFFGGTGSGSWFDLVVAAKMSKGVYTAPGPANLVHEWAYLPDFAVGFVGLARNLDKLGFYEALTSPATPSPIMDIKAAAEKALGRPLKMTSMPWWVLRAGSPFVAMWREIVSMSYLRFEPHRLVSDRLEDIIGEIPHTPLDKAVAEALKESASTRSCIKTQLKCMSPRSVPRFWGQRHASKQRLWTKIPLAVLAQSLEISNRMAIMRRLFITVGEITITKGRRCVTYVRFQSKMPLACSPGRPARPPSSPAAATSW